MTTLRLAIPKGDAGAEVTARVMRKLIELGKRDPRVRQTAEIILKTFDVPAHDKWREVRSIYLWVKRNVRYIRDPWDIEYVQTPGRMLETLTGDCDDYTVLLGALLESVGYPVDIKVVARKGRRNLHHVYPVVSMDGVSIGLDAAMPVAFGVEATDLGRVKLYRSELRPMSRIDVYAGLGAAPGAITLVPSGEPPPADLPPGAVDVVVKPGGVIKKLVTPEPPPPADRPTVGGCWGIRWEPVMLKVNQSLTDRCINERIGAGLIKAESGSKLVVTPVSQEGYHMVTAMAEAPDIYHPPPGVPLPEGRARCDWGVGKAVQVLQSGESVSGHCVKRFMEMGKYRPAPGCRLLYQGPDDPTVLPGPGGTVTCVQVGYDQPPGNGVVPTNGVTPEYREPVTPGVRPDSYAPTIVTVPTGAPAVKEAGFPTWAIIAVLGAVVLPMLMTKGR